MRIPGSIVPPSTQQPPPKGTEKAANANGEAAGTGGAGGAPPAPPASPWTLDEAATVLRGAADALPLLGDFKFSAAPAGSTPPPSGPTVMGKYQTERFHQNFQMWTANEQEHFAKLLTRTENPNEIDYLLKAVAAGHSVVEVSKFADAIRGQSDEWLHRKLRVTADAAGGHGIKQQWNDSCGPTTAQTIRAEMDPIYALELNRSNFDITNAGGDIPVGNYQAADEQRRVLEKNDGKAVNRGQGGGEGMKLGGALADIAKWTGVTYTSRTANAKGFAKLDADLAKGIPGALRVTDAKNSGGHFVAVTGVTGTGANKTYIIHDPWDGKTVHVKASDLAAGKVDPPIAGWNKVSTVYTSKD